MGEVTGTLGDTVRRKRYGKTVVYSRPGKYRISKSKQAKAGRNAFALSVAFAKNINSIPELKQIWQLAKLEGVVAYNRMIKYNKKYIEVDKLTSRNTITPGGIYLLLKDLEITGNKITFKIDLSGELLKSLLQIPFNLFYTLYFHNPISTNNKPFEITARTKIVEIGSVNGIIDIDIKLDSLTQQILTGFTNVICYIAASRFNGKKKEIFWTGTTANEFQLNLSNKFYSKL